MKMIQPLHNKNDCSLIQVGVRSVHSQSIRPESSSWMAIERDNGKTKASCWLAWKRHLSMKQGSLFVLFCLYLRDTPKWDASERVLGLFGKFSRRRGASVWRWVALYLSFLHIQPRHDHDPASWGDLLANELGQLYIGVKANVPLKSSIPIGAEVEISIKALH
jgi:hypothetical protein